MPQAVFFDLDGTLADTAPDLSQALNALLAECGRTPLAPATLRPHVSGGARALLRAGFDITPDDPGYDALRARFLDLYEASRHVATALFEGMGPLLDALEQRGIVWGVVTNKPQRFTDPLMAALGIDHRAAAIVSGDSTARTKPDPLPLLHASRLAGVAPAASAYVGDDLRDILAGRAAGMHTFAAAWGYLGDGPPVADWGADRLLDRPEALLEELDQALW